MRHSTRWWQDVAVGLITLTVGLVCARLALTGEYAALVKPSLRPWLWLAGAAAVVMAAWTLWGTRHDGGGHAHGRPALVGVLLIVPMLILCTLPTPSAGLHAARRGAQGAVIGPAPASLPPLPDDPVVAIRLDDYVIRTTLRDPSSMQGRTFSMVGYVVNQGDGKPWLLSRLKVSCCVADALPFTVVAVGASPQPDRLWLEVTGSYEPAADGMARLRVQSVRQVPVPDQPLLS